MITTAFRSIRLYLVGSLISLVGIGTMIAQHEWQKPKPLIAKAELAKIVGKLDATEPSKELRILWVWGYDANHRPGAHDYLKVRDLMCGLLRKVPRVTVTEVFHFPTRKQLEEADLMAMYLHLPNLSDSQYTDFKSFIQRGGGVVALHETAIMRPASAGKKLATCLGMAWDEGRSEWGAIFDDISIKNSHPIFAGFPEKLRIMDEFYWNLNQIDGVNILGTVRTGPPHGSRGPLPSKALSKEPSPVFWTLEMGKGRVFGTTTGHNTFSYYDPEFRIVIFRALAWVAREKPDPFLPLVFDGITDKQNRVGIVSDMRGWKGKLRKRPQK
ncbi:ThuA domain-containing protein [bacterium]|jgi:type 1 glutamine amidotransferase|nr:ThuA domain-containing protein [bacterium]